MQNELVWNFYPGMEFAEVASQTMELLTLPYLSRDEGGFYGDEDAARARREGLERVLFLLPYLAKSDAFQHWVYTEAPEDVSIAEIDAKWLELDERFAPGVDWSGLERERVKGWQYFHIFAVPFYMLEYAFAWLGAVQIWQNALARHRRRRWRNTAPHSRWAGRDPCLTCSKPPGRASPSTGRRSVS